MLTIEEGNQSVVVTASGRLTADDYRRFVNDFERLARARGPLRALLELRHFRAGSCPPLFGGRCGLRDIAKTRDDLSIRVAQRRRRLPRFAPRCYLCAA
jgi:hypothetical protein